MNIIDDTSEKYLTMIEQRDREMKEFEEWEKKASDMFVSNNFYRDKKEWWSFWDADKDVITKMLQNDIRLFLQKVGSRFSWEIKITYRAWVPKAMTADFQSLNGSANDVRDELCGFVSDSWFITHKQYEKEKKLYWEKLYKYSDKDWDANIDEWKKTWIIHTVPKKELKNK